MKEFPSEAEVLFSQAEENAMWRYNNYKRLSEMVFSTVGEDVKEEA